MPGTLSTISEYAKMTLYKIDPPEQTKDKIHIGNIKNIIKMCERHCKGRKKDLDVSLFIDFIKNNDTIGILMWMNLTTNINKKMEKSRKPHPCIHSSFKSNDPIQCPSPSMYHPFHDDKSNDDLSSESENESDDDLSSDSEKDASDSENDSEKDASDSENESDEDLSSENKSEEYGYSPLMILIKFSHKISFVDYLVRQCLKKGGDPYLEEPGASWNTVNMLVSSSPVNYDLLKLFFQQKVDFNRLDSTGYNPLMTMLEWNPDKKLAGFLLEHRTNPNITNINGNTSLMKYLIYDDDDDIMWYELLLDYGTNPNIVNEEGETSLILAVKFNRNKKTVEKLINYGADHSIKDNKGNDAFVYALENRNRDIIELLLNAGADLSIPKTLTKEIETLLDYYQKQKNSIFDEYKSLFELRKSYPEISPVQFEFLKDKKIDLIMLHLHTLSYYSKFRINPDSLIESWNDIANPIICDNGYWYTEEELKTWIEKGKLECPYTRVPLSNINIIYAKFTEIKLAPSLLSTFNKKLK